MDILKTLPLEPPKRFKKWAEKQDFFRKQHALTYHFCWTGEKGHKQRAVECHCSACGAVYYRPYRPRGQNDWGSYSFEEKGLRYSSRNSALCAVCGVEVTVLLVPPGRTVGLINANFLDVTAYRGQLRLIVWQGEICFDAKAQKTVDWYRYEAYVFEGRKAYRFRSYDRFMYTVRYLDAWKKSTFSSFKPVRFSQVCPFNESVLAKSVLPHCKLDRFLQDSNGDPVAYLRFYKERKNAEALVLAGLSDLLSRYLRHRNDLDLDFKQHKPHRILKLSKEDFLLLCKQDDVYSAARVMQDLSSRGVHLSSFDAKACAQLNWKVDKLYGSNFIRLLHYLVKQRSKLASQDYYIDYLDYAKKLGLNLADEGVLYPKDLVVAHNRAVDAYEAKQDECLHAAFAARFKELSRFAWEKDGLMIFPARTQADLIREGEKLHHCVARYAEGHSRGSTAIFFIRSASNPDEPFYTLEFDEKRCAVCQNRGKHNCSRTKEIEDFEVAWLEYVKQIKEKKEKKKHGRNAAIRSA